MKIDLELVKGYVISELDRMRNHDMEQNHIIFTEFKDPDSFIDSRLDVEIDMLATDLEERISEFVTESLLQHAIDTNDFLINEDE